MKELNVLIERKDGKLVVSSRIIAEQLGKEHKHVLAKIKECLNIEDGQKFGTPIEAIESTYLNSQNKIQPEYLVTKDGFILLMMNYTGYNDFKRAYINEFNRMESELTKFKLPTTYKEAVQDLLLQIEENEKLQLENSKQKEVIDVQSKEIEYKEDVIIGLVDTITLEEKRQTLNKVVRHKGANYQERWQLLYKHFEDKYHLNLKIRRENWDKVNKPKSKSMVDFIDRGLGKLPELYEIATKLFEGDIKEIISHYEDIR